MSIAISSTGMGAGRSGRIPASLLLLRPDNTSHVGTFDLVGLLDETIERRTMSADARGVRLSCLTLDEIEVIGAENASAAAIDALLVDALREAAPGTRLDCDVRIVNGWAVLQIRFLRPAGCSARTRSEVCGAMIERRWPMPEIDR